MSSALSVLVKSGKKGIERTGGDAGGVAGAGDEGEDVLLECAWSDDVRIGRGDDGEDFIADENAVTVSCCCCEDCRDRGKEGC